ncbi:MAG: hypothetical protein FWG45_04470 [Oscillospiraceae bacterium]|nr:hypothetical protein [Oscillospiraceae bacterium]
MARYVNDFPTNKADEQLMAIASQCLNDMGYKPHNYKGEAGVFKKGDGWLTAPMFIKLSSMSGAVHVEAFTKFAILPGVFMGEYGTDGAFLIVPKRLLKGNVEKLEYALKN